MEMKDLQEKLTAVGYEPRRRELLAILGALALDPAKAGARALLLEGPPGAGKSALAEAAAKALGGEFIFCQFHAWTDSDELFTGIDVASAVAGDATSVRQDGVLARVARASVEHDLVVCCLDEIDKGHERSEALLLDWLQTGRVPIQPGRHLQTRLSRCLVFLTSNGMRELSDALLRRVRRVRMEMLPVERQDAILSLRCPDVPPGVRTLGARACRAVAQAEGTSLSLQEIERALSEMLLAEGVSDIRETLSGWAARTARGAQAAAREQLVAAIWAELTKANRGLG